MPPKSSATSKTAISVPKSPPKSCRSTWKWAKSATDTTVEPPVKKFATGYEEEGQEIGQSRPKGGKGVVRGKGIRCANNQYMNFRSIQLIVLIGKL